MALGKEIKMTRPKKCPRCGSTRVSIDEYNGFYCVRCGFRNSEVDLAQFVDFEEISSSF